MLVMLFIFFVLLSRVALIIATWWPGMVNSESLLEFLLFTWTEIFFSRE